MIDEPAPPAARPTARPSSTAGRNYLIFIGLMIALLGSLFVALMARSFFRAKAMREWPEVACVILTSEVEERRHDQNSATEFRQDLSYGYVWQGVAYTSDRLSLRGSPWSSRRALVEERVASYPVGQKTTCWVNPADANFATLKPDSLAPGYSIWFPALFVIGGLRITYRAIFLKKT